MTDRKDIVERLRNPLYPDHLSANHSTMKEAADELTTLRAENERLRGALGIIADGRGHCSACGVLANGSFGGVITCDCAGGSWEPPDKSDIARAALKKEGEG